MTAERLVALYASPMQMDTAMLLHFNVHTPHHDGGGGAVREPPRPAKRDGSPAPSTGPAGSADWCACCGAAC